MAPFALGDLRWDAADGARDWTAERIKAAIEAAEVGTYDWDPVRGTLDWSPRCKALFGLPPDAHVDYDVFLSRVHPDDRPLIDRTAAACLDPEGSGEYHIEYRVYGAHEAVRWVEVRGRAFFSGEPGRRSAERVIGTVVDITGRKAMEAEQRAEEARSRLAMSAGGLIAWEIDTMSGAIVAHAGLGDLFGIPQEQLTGSMDDFVGRVHPEDHDWVLAAFNAARVVGGEPRRVSRRPIWLSHAAKATSSVWA